jgi:hypothetical protein
MVRNVGKSDAGIRWFLAVVFFATSIAFNSSLTVSLIAALFGLIMVATALTRTCPMYSILRISTAKGGPSIPPAQ